MKRVVILLILLFSLIFSYAYAHNSSLEDIKARGVLRIGIEPTYPPFEVINNQSDIVGFDVDMAKAFAKSIGVDVEFINTEWDNLIPDLNSGKYDMLISGITITSERKELVDFCNPYFASGQAILLNSSNKSIKSFRDINKPGIRIVSKDGTTAGELVKTFFTKADVILIDDTEKNIVEYVLNNKADLFIYDLPFLSLIAVNYPEKLIFLEQPFTYEPLGAAVVKGNDSLRRAMNDFIKTIKVNGTYEKLYNYWFKNASWQENIVL